MRHFCRSCDAYLQAVEFYPSAIAKHARKCKRCSNAERQVARCRSVEARVLNQITQRETRKGCRGATAHGLDLSDVARILDCFGHQSVASGCATGGITVVRRDDAQPLSLENCAVLTSAEARLEGRFPGRVLDAEARERCRNCATVVCRPPLGPEPPQARFTFFSR